MISQKNLVETVAPPPRPTVIAPTPPPRSARPRGDFARLGGAGALTLPPALWRGAQRLGGAAGPREPTRAPIAGPTAVFRRLGAHGTPFVVPFPRGLLSQDGFEPEEGVA